MPLLFGRFCYALLITINTIETCCKGSAISKGELIFTVNNIRILKKQSHTLIAVPGSGLELRCSTTRSSDNVTMSSSHGVSIADNFENFSSLVIPAMSCADTGSYFCQAKGKSARRVDITMTKCPPRLCHRQPPLKRIRANLGDNKSINLCVVAANLNDTTFKLNGQLLNLLPRNYQRQVTVSQEEYQQNKYQLSSRPKRSNSFTHLLTISIRNLTLQDLGHYTFVLQSEHDQKITFSFFIYCNGCFVCQNQVKRHLLIGYNNTIVEVRSSLERFKIVSSRSSRTIGEKERDSLRNAIHNVTKRCASFTCTVFDLNGRTFKRNVYILNKLCPPFQIEQIETTYEYGDHRKYRFQLISIENVSTTAQLDNETLVINNKHQTKDMSLQCRNKLFKYKCTFKHNNVTNKGMKLTIKDVLNRSFTLKLQYRGNHRTKTNKGVKKIFFEDGKNLKFKLKIHPGRKLKKLKILGKPVTSNIYSNEASYFIISNKTIITVVIRNVTLYNECISSSCTARLITQRRKVDKRNVRFKFIRRHTRQEKQADSQTHVIFTVNNVSSVGDTFQFVTLLNTWNSFNCSGENASIKHKNKLIGHSSKTWTSVVLNKTQDQGIYSCSSDNAVKTLVMGIQSCPPRLCTPYDNVATVEHSKLQFETCIFGATIKRWKVAVVKKLFPVSDVTFTYTLNKNTRSAFHHDLTITFMSRTELDTDVLLLKINGVIVSQINLIQVKDVAIKRHFVLIVMTGLAVLLTLLAGGVTWKYFAVSSSIENKEVLKNNVSKAKKRRHENISSNNAYTSFGFIKSLDKNNMTQSLNKCLKLTYTLCQSLKRLKTDIGRGQGKDLKKRRLSDLSLVSSSENVMLRDELSSSYMSRVRENVDVDVHLKGSNKDTKEPSYDNDNILDASQSVIDPNVANIHQRSAEDDYKLIPDPKELREVMSLGRYINDDGLIYISLAHDYVGNQYKRKQKTKQNSTSAITEEDKVIYADINWIKTCLLAETNLDKST